MQVETDALAVTGSRGLVELSASVAGLPRLGRGVWWWLRVLEKAASGALNAVTARVSKTDFPQPKLSSPSFNGSTGNGVQVRTRWPG